MWVIIVLALVATVPAAPTDPDESQFNIMLSGAQESVNQINEHQDQINDESQLISMRSRAQEIVNQMNKILDLKKNESQLISMRSRTQEIVNEINEILDQIKAVSTPADICVHDNCTDPCEGLCGANAECEPTVNGPACCCLPGYSGHPFTGCMDEDESRLIILRSSAQESVNQINEILDLIKDESRLIILRSKAQEIVNQINEILDLRKVANGCTSDSDCATDRMCLYNQCKDPCPGACGMNADCKVANHHTICACMRGFYLNKTSDCLPIAQPNCQSNIHCATDQACLQERCADPCVGVCGNNTVCKVTNHHPSCACKTGYSGDPFVQCDPMFPHEVHDFSNETKQVVNGERSKRFKVFSDKKTRDAAFDYCRSKNMTLAAIENEEENNHTVLLIGNSDNYHYVSGLLKQMPWVFYWATTGEEVTYSKWQAGYPSADEDLYKCILVSKTGWVSGRCYVERPFICQYYEP